MGDLEILEWHALAEGLREAWNERIEMLLPAPSLLKELSGPGLSLEEFDARVLSAKVGQDAVLAGRLLGVANSAKFGLTQPMTSIQRAMVHLGFNLVKSIIATYLVECGFSKAPPLPQAHIEFVRRWTAGASVLAFRWGQEVQLPDPATVSTVALLSRVGTLLIAMAEPKPDKEYRALSSESARLRYELDTWRLTTPTLSAELARRWGLPYPVPELLWKVWQPAIKVVSPDPLDPYLRALTLVAASVALVEFHLRRPTDGPAELWEEEGYQFLAHNVGEHHLRDGLSAVWRNARVQRELACVLE
jgi:HD-like signal output (HDOD) protein